ncbi:MAG: hypothetical protein JW837_02035 [Sedimentisphaerales bacterium]|nr:hypothetical protein [Sedimentisphaerales bacterium]
MKLFTIRKSILGLSVLIVIIVVITIYSSQDPKYFRVVFGQDEKISMLGIVKRSIGTVKGYNVAYIDENMNGNLTDEVAKKFIREKRGSRAGWLEPRFEFYGPFKADQKAKYTLDIYFLNRKIPVRISENEHYFHWSLDTGRWNYFFINGRIKLFSSAADAMKGEPVRLAGRCWWDINTRTRDGNAMVSAGLKDENGCTLRIIRRTREIVSPTLTLAKDDKVVMEEKMEFG